MSTPSGAIRNDKSYGAYVTGFLLCFAGAVCFSTKAIFVKLAYRETHIDAVTLLALRMLFSIPFFLISAAISSSKTTNVKFTLPQWFGVAGIGLLGYYVSSYLDFVGLQFVSAGMERLILFIYPTLVLLITAVFFKTKIRPRQWWAVVITYAGLFIAFFGEIDLSAAQDEHFYWGAFMIVLCAITYASYIAGSGQLIPVVGASKFNSYAMTFACCGVLIHYFIVSDTSLLNLSNDVYLYSASMAIFATVVPSYLITAGIKRIGADNAAIVGSVGPVSTIVQAYFFLQEPILALQLVGTALILVGVLMIGKK
ncbi:DMT family transporter [Pseudochryseolinea flava]|uniref:EamA/RhaT family transporter n=1 Tax=Pseudochryseolinea flava TaxID=2059302 RepID=A0A364YAB9_9BACT|nr:DMT family transporter [Pseudochryseolinea flava]RAW03279.1 EamA/RhaT family transporter [Pseudochryseolinea flava]